MSRNRVELRSSWFDTAEASNAGNDAAPPETVDDMPERVIAHDPPIANVTAPDITDRLPSIQMSDTRPVAVVGAHGGAGATSLAAIDPELLFDCGAAWPSTHGKQACILVARTSARGLHAAQTALQQWAAAETPSVDVLGLVLIADAQANCRNHSKSLCTWFLAVPPERGICRGTRQCVWIWENTMPIRRSSKLIRNLKTLIDH